MTLEFPIGLLQVPKPENDGSIASQLKAAGYFSGVNAGIIAARETLQTVFKDDTATAVRIAEVLDTENLDYIKESNPNG